MELHVNFGDGKSEHIDWYKLLMIGEITPNKPLQGYSSDSIAGKFAQENITSYLIENPGEVHEKYDSAIGCI